MNDEIECPIDRRTINTVLEALYKVHHSIDCDTWVHSIYQDRHHPNYTSQKYDLWLKQPLYYIAQAPDFRAGLIDLVQRRISHDIKEARRLGPDPNRIAMLPVREEE
tara:strand:+ start:756 stop:1076 length:321 start_codon:yes stop_codon:yes gene_type:complete